MRKKGFKFFRASKHPATCCDESTTLRTPYYDPFFYVALRFPLCDEIDMIMIIRRSCNDPASQTSISMISSQSERGVQSFTVIDQANFIGSHVDWALSEIWIPASMVAKIVTVSRFRAVFSATEMSQLQQRHPQRRQQSASQGSGSNA